MHELVEHTADLEVRIAAACLDDVFTEAATALFEIIVGDLSQVHARMTRTFAVAVAAPHDMLHDLLSELHAAFEVERMLYREFRALHADGPLQVVAMGEPFDESRHLLAHEIKAVTRHSLAVRPTPSGWEAEFVVDV